VTRSYRSRDIEHLAAGVVARRFQAFARPAQRKLRQLDAAHDLRDLAQFPGNRLEADRIGQYSIRINDQVRIVFRWQDGDAFDVDIVDYH
jgi:proteic killer suppression protein